MARIIGEIMKGKISGTTIAVALMLTLAVGGAAALTALPTTETVSVDDNVTELEIVVENITDTDTSSHTDAKITVFGTDGTSSTAVNTTIVSTTTDRNTAVYSFGAGNESINATKHPMYDVKLAANSSTNTSVDSLSVHKIETSGGGGALLSGDELIGGVPNQALVGGALVLLIGLAAWRIE